jgi:hypothetical protein
MYNKKWKVYTLIFLGLLLNAIIYNVFFQPTTNSAAREGGIFGGIYYVFCLWIDELDRRALR